MKTECWYSAISGRVILSMQPAEAALICGVMQGLPLSEEANKLVEVLKPVLAVAEIAEMQNWRTCQYCGNGQLEPSLDDKTIAHCDNCGTEARLS